MTIRLRLALWYGFAIAVTAAVGSAIAWFGFASDLRSTLQETLSVQVADTTAALNTGEGQTALREDPARPGIFTVILDPSGKVVLASPNAPAGIGPVTPGDSTWRPPGAAADDALFAGVAGDGSTIIAGSSLAQIQDELERLAFLLALAGAFGTAGSLAGGWWLARRALAPVAGLVGEADRIHGSEASFGHRLHAAHAADELGHLAATLNRMLDRVERSLHRQRAFVASASHDLRTPIAALRTELELALRTGGTREELQAAIDDALGDVRRLGTLADDLLGLAAAEGDGRAISLEPVELRELVQGVAERTAASAAGPEIGFELLVELGTIVTDRVRVEQALANLLANAVRYSPPGATVTVSAHRIVDAADGGGSRSVLDVSVLDRGPGVPPTAIGMLFVPFTRSRDPGGGTGLGLATAEAAVRALGGRIGYRDRPGGGAWFWFRLPALDTA